MSRPIEGIWARRNTSGVRDVQCTCKQVSVKRLCLDPYSNLNLIGIRFADRHGTMPLSDVVEARAISYNAHPRHEMYGDALHSTAAKLLCSCVRNAMTYKVIVCFGDGSTFQCEMSTG